MELPGIDFWGGDECCTFRVETYEEAKAIAIQRLTSEGQHAMWDSGSKTYFPKTVKGMGDERHLTFGPTATLFYATASGKFIHWILKIKVIYFKFMIFFETKYIL